MHVPRTLALGLLLVAVPLSGCIGVANMSEFKARVTGDERTPTIQPTSPNAAPVAAVAANRTRVPVGAPIVVDAGGSEDPDGRIVGVEWQVDGADAGGGARLNWSFATPGRHQVQATVRDDGGATDAATVVVQVVANAPPNASMRIQGPDDAATQRVRVGDDVTFSAAASSDPDGDALTATWRVGDLRRTGTRFTHAFEEAGTYRVRLTVEDEAGNRDRLNRSLAVDARGSRSGSLTVRNATAAVDVPVRAGAVNLSVELAYSADLPLEDVDLALDGPGDAGAAADGDEATMPGSYRVDLAVTDPAEGSWTIRAELDSGLDAPYELTWTLRYGLGA